MYSKKYLFVCSLFFAFVYAQEKSEDGIIEDSRIRAIQKAIEQQQSVKDSIQEVYEREKQHTIKPQQTNIESLQLGIHDTKDEKERKKVLEKIAQNEYKTQLFLGVQLGATLGIVADNKNWLPTLNLKLGFQNFLGVTKKQVGMRIYLDTLFASNILSSLKNDPFADFIDSSFNAVNINAEAVYELPITNTMRFGVGVGFGVGYMTYRDMYWDKLNGFASNVSLLVYLSLYERHRIEIGFKTFFYHYGSYVTRKLGGVVQNPSLLYSRDFAKPMNFNVGWAYVF